MLANKKILLGTCGGIALYKVCDLVRELKKLNVDVRVVMTSASTRFVSPLTFSTLSENEVFVDMLPANQSTGTDVSVNHIKLALWADLILIAPATANTIAKITHGFTDNLLTSLVLASRSPVVLCPSMDANMFDNAATQDNIRTLKSRGYKIIEPDSGPLASGLSGKGRLPEADTIVKYISKIFQTEPSQDDKKDLLGKNILITAGPTHEFIDPVRYISNRSSGKMGFELAKVASKRGANVTLISGKVNLPIPQNVNYIPVITSKEMFESVKDNYASQHIIIMAAAVADYEVQNYSELKLKKDDKDFSLELKKTTDILAWLGRNRTSNSTIVGFALETNNEIANAREKIVSKNIDMVVINNPLVPGAGFETDTNIVTILNKNGEIINYPKMSKEEIANNILDYSITINKK
jgi:phosphopantothenoylcysteine decarboxylase/phosphopantothenate--cysteine ligase